MIISFEVLDFFDIFIYFQSNCNFLGFKEIYEFIKQNGFLDYKRKKSRTEKTPPKDSAKKSKVIEKEKKAKAAHKIKKIHSNVNVNNCSNSHVRRIEKNTNESKNYYIIEI